MKVSYRDFSDFMRNDGYKANEIRHLFSAVKSMDRESIGWVVRWLCLGEFPKKEVEGITAEYLITNCGYKPINAFIILDWLKADPQAAKYFILKAPSGMDPSESVGREMEQFLSEKGIETEPAEAIDESDISG